MNALPRSALAVLLAAALVAPLARPASAPAGAAPGCVTTDEAKAAGSDESGPPRFSAAFRRTSITLDVSLDGMDGRKLPISIEDVCKVPPKLVNEAKQLSGTDGVAFVYSSTRIVKGGHVVAKRRRKAELSGADTAAVVARLAQTRDWSKDEDGTAVPTFRASRIDLTD
jgi:hypothetical protein